ncbi:MAG TPA: hypothetical protein VFY63_17185 [Pseudorhizobium sp.]|nr:hypothetical protein [Pseudorhizobium sp.]
MTKTVSVSAHQRKVEKSPAYIDTHLALFSRRADRIAFCQRHGVHLVGYDDPRLSKPIADPVPGPGRSLTEIAAQLMGLAKLAKNIGKARQ